MSDRLHAEQLATESGVDLERVAELTEVGVLVQAQGGGYRAGDVQRVLVAGALEEAGLTLELQRRGIEAGILSYEATDLIYASPGPFSTRTLSEVAVELDADPEFLARVITALGLPHPVLDAPMRASDEEQLRGLVTAWRAVASDELVLRAARVYGDGLQRIAEGWMAIYADAVLAPVADRPVPWDEMRTRALEPGMAVLASARGMLSWLFDRHLTHALNGLNFDSIEHQLGLLGIGVPAPPNPEAIVFADLAGYTQLTEERGDTVAADVATRLAALADEVADTHRGRLVKLLGDGVMLHLPDPASAVEAAVVLRDAMAPAALPPAHVGIHAGPLIRRESDYFGRTVNVAARLGSQANAGEILVTPEVAAAAPAWSYAAPAPMQLKGIPEPVLALAVRGRA